jgi:hypothetical protein
LHIVDNVVYFSFCGIHSSEGNVLRKLQPRSTWFLTGLGSLATTQREYIALHAFHRLNVQVMCISFSYRYCLLFCI